ncbi:hypothetical protein BFV98_29980 [Micromonospora sp. WMMB235]|nr:hypothetical protein BFV98_29980 [Micromonospora sp. WMMB235]
MVTGEMAHIVAASRQGPRGRGVLTDDERNSAENLILLCERHHKIVDRRPRTYTVDVLTEMKRRHEAPFLAAPAEATAAPVVSETLLSSLLVVSELPQQIRSAPYVAASPKEVAATVRWDADEGPVAFITRERRLFAFHDLRSASGPFARSVDRGAVESLTARDLCSTSDGQRWYVELLNRTLSWHLRSLGMRFDQGHNRYYFTLREDGSSPRMDYRSKTGRAMSRDVVRPNERSALEDHHECRRAWRGPCRRSLLAEIAEVAGLSEPFGDAFAGLRRRPARSGPGRGGPGGDGRRWWWGDLGPGRAE